MLTILLVEDNEDLVELIRFHLEKEKFAVRVARNGIEALKLLKTHSFQLVILDLMIPSISGLDILAYMKANSDLKGTPVIIESAKREDTDIVRGLEMGAEDYLTKPFSPKVLLARIHKILSRKELKNSYSWRQGTIKVNTDSREVRIEGEIVPFTQVEFDILVFLAKNPGRVVSRDNILEGVWKDEVYVINRVIDVHVTSLRKKLQCPSLIQTVRGVGYKIETPENET